MKDEIGEYRELVMLDEDGAPTGITVRTYSLLESDKEGLLTEDAVNEKIYRMRHAHALGKVAEKVDLRNPRISLRYRPDIGEFEAYDMDEEERKMREKHGDLIDKIRERLKNNDDALEGALKFIYGDSALELPSKKPPLELEEKPE